MNFDVEHPANGIAVVRGAGRLNMIAAPALRDVVDRSVNDQRPTVIVDMSETTFVDSSGLGALIAGLKTARGAGGDLRLAAVPPSVLTVLSMTNLNRILRPYPTVTEAMA